MILHRIADYDVDENNEKTVSTEKLSSIDVSPIYRVLTISKLC